MRLLDLFCGAGGAAIKERFWRYVDIGRGDECWIWTGSLHSGGYGQLNINRYPYRAHRLSWALHFGEPTASVLHHCDNPRCVNPRHLFLGSQADNMADAAAKGRVRGKVSPGESNGQAKLTVALVREARQLHAAGTSFHALARRYGVNRKTITQAVRGERWTHA